MTTHVQAGASHGSQAHISKHLHRIGYHFRQDIFDQGCALLGYEVRGGKLHRDPLPSDMWGCEQATDGYGSRSDSVGGPERSATEQEALAVKLAIKELFPRLPQKDLEEIWRRAFKAVRLNATFTHSVLLTSFPGCQDGRQRKIHPSATTGTARDCRTCPSSIHRLRQPTASCRLARSQSSSARAVLGKAPRVAWRA